MAAALACTALRRLPASLICWESEEKAALLLCVSDRERERLAWAAERVEKSSHRRRETAAQVRRRQPRGVAERGLRLEAASPSIAEGGRGAGKKWGWGEKEREMWRD